MSCRCSFFRPPCLDRSVESPVDRSPSTSVFTHAKKEGEKSLRHLIITTIALIAVAVLLIALSRLGTGLGHLPATRMTGFSFIYHFAALHVFFIGAGVGVVAVAFAIACACKARASAIEQDGLAAAVRATPRALGGAERVV